MIAYIRHGYIRAQVGLGTRMVRCLRMESATTLRLLEKLDNGYVHTYIQDNNLLLDDLSFALHSYWYLVSPIIRTFYLLGMYYYGNHT